MSTEKSGAESSSAESSNTERTPGWGGWGFVVVILVAMGLFSAVQALAD